MKEKGSLVTIYLLSICLSVCPSFSKTLNFYSMHIRNILSLYLISVAYAYRFCYEINRFSVILSLTMQFSAVKYCTDTNL